MSRKLLEEDRLLTTPEAAACIRMSASFLHKKRVEGGGPRFVKLGRLVFYRPRDLDSWLNSLVRASTSDKGRPARPVRKPGALPPPSVPPAP